MKINFKVVIIETIKYSFLSGVIGIGVTIPLIIVFNWQTDITLFRGFSAGFIMGLICYNAFTLIASSNLKFRTLLSFLAVSVVIAAISYFYSRFLGHAEHFVAMIASAFSVVMGLLSTSLMYLYKIRLNRKLHKAQNRLTEKVKTQTKINYEAFS